MAALTVESLSLTSFSLWRGASAILFLLGHGLDVSTLPKREHDYQHEMPLVGLVQLVFLVQYSFKPRALEKRETAERLQENGKFLKTVGHLWGRSSNHRYDKGHGWRAWLYSGHEWRPWLTPWGTTGCSKMLQAIQYSFVLCSYTL